MTTINENFLLLQKNYLFADIARRVNAYRQAHPEADLISLGIGDVTRPLAPAVIEALHRATEEMADGTSFRGYGPEHGYEFLREAIARHDFAPRGITLDTDEIFINDGAKSDTGNFGDILGSGNTICVTDPIYPVYIDSNVMGGRAGVFDGNSWSRITYSPCNEANDFVPALPEHPADLIYLCYPNNPTGTVLGRAELKKVGGLRPAKRQHHPLRCRLRSLHFVSRHSAQHLRDRGCRTLRRRVPFLFQNRRLYRPALRIHRSAQSPDGKDHRGRGSVAQPVVEPAAVYKIQRNGLHRATRRRSHLQPRGPAAGTRDHRLLHDQRPHHAGNPRRKRFQGSGGTDAPYLWVKTPEGTGSWEFFEQLLTQARIVCTPGVGFGPAGEGYIRLTAFGRRKDCETAMQRLKERTGRQV